MREWWKRARPSLIANIAYVFARLIDVTLRVRSHGEEYLAPSSKGKVLAGWHGRSFLALTRWKNRGYYVLISHSRDGEIMNKLFTRFGYRVIRGSTGVEKGGARAAAECAKVLKSGGIIVFAADGAKGPAHIVQRGVLWLAQKGEAEVVPVTSSARPRKLVRSWDKYQIPLPFAKAVINVGPPTEIPRDASDSQLEGLRLKVQDDINSVEHRAEQEMGWN